MILLRLYRLCFFKIIDGGISNKLLDHFLFSNIN